MRFALLELQTGTPLAQQLTTGTQPQFVEALRPHLYRHNFASGTLQMLVYDSAGSTLIASSQTLNISQLDGGFAYSHGYYTFNVNVGLAANTTYTFKLVGASGYTFSEAAYIGWVNGLDLGKYPATTTPSDAFHYPLDIEVWNRSQV